MGNWINKEWSQLEGSDDENINNNPISKQKIKTIKNKDSSNLENLTPVPSYGSNLTNAELDPRSPSTNIQRTPICCLNEESKKIVNNIPKFSMNDPRSPTTEYNRTPIHLNNNSNEKKIINQNDLNSSDFNDSIASNSFDTSSFSVSDSSILLQYTQENSNFYLTTNTLLNNNSHESPTRQTTTTTTIISASCTKSITSNMPRHILQRKQVEKLNKKKLIDKENDF